MSAINIGISPTANYIQIAPTAPSSLTATADGGYQRIDLAWTDNSDNEDGFKIERSLDGATGWTQIATVGAGVVTDTDYGLTEGITYYYRVRAYRQTANSAYSNVANATTFQPTDISGAIWLSADLDVYTDTAKTTPATAYFDPVKTWVDQGGGALDFVHGTAAQWPLLMTNLLNGHDVLYFDQDYDWFFDDSITSLETDELTWFGLFVIEDISDIHTILWSNYSSGDDIWGMAANATNKFVYARNSSEVQQTVTWSVNPKWEVIAGRWNSDNTVDGWQDGVVNGSPASGADASVTGHIRSGVGANPAAFGANFHLGGLLSQLIMVPSALSDANVQLLNEFLEDKKISPNFSIDSSATLWTGSGSTDWLGRPQIIDDGSKWVAIYRQADIHSYDVTSVFHIRFSTNEGSSWYAADTWTDGSTAITGAPFSENNAGAGVTDAIIIQAPNDDLLIHISETHASTANRYGTYQYRSDDSGLTWSNEGKILNDNTIISGGGQAAVIGTDIYVAAFIDPGADKAAPFNSALYKSVDNGTNWSKVSDITSTSENTNEVGLVYLGGNNLLAILRDTSVLTTYLRLSDDLGSTWDTLDDEIAQLGLFLRPQFAVFSDEPDRIYLHGRQIVIDLSGRWQFTAVYYSDDDGVTWEGPSSMDLVLHEDAGYCSMLKKTNGDYYLLTYEGTQDTSDIVEYIFSAL
jgi:hypothetical protein